MMRLVTHAVAGLLLSAGALVSASPAGSRQAPPIRSATAGVVIDVSVVDRQGVPVRDLAPEDFEVKENGVLQRLTSAQLVQTAVAPAAASVSAGSASVSGGTQPTSRASATATTPAPRPVSVTAILFDRLAAEARPAAHQAALAYLSTLSPHDDYAGMFLADLSLVTFAPFTNDPQVLRAGLGRMAVRAPSNTVTGSPDARIAPLLPSIPPTVGAEYPAGFAGVERMREPEAATDRTREMAGEPGLIQLLLNMEKQYRALMDELNGQASVAGLRATVEAMRALPGRKTILYFSEALPVTSHVKPLLDDLIVRANSANVSIYTVDAAGLRVHSQELEVKREIDVAGAQGIGDVPRPDGAWTKDAERQQQVVESRAAAVLGRLANETGGFLVNNTNALGAGVARMRQDRSIYYLLGYQSTNPALDGTFRRVSVKVKRKDVTVLARQGYRASPVATR